MRIHGFRNTMACQYTPQRYLLYRDGSCIVEEPADERNPKPAAKIAAAVATMVKSKNILATA